MEKDASIWDSCGLDENSVARAFSRMFPGRWKYMGKKTWMYYDEENKTWKEDTNARILVNFLRTDACAQIRQRAQWYHENCTTYDDQYICQRLLVLAQRLQLHAFQRKVLKELCEFYVSG